MRLPNPAAVGDTLRLRFAGHMPQPVFLLDTPQSAPTDKPQLSQTARMLSDIMLRVPERSLPTLTPPGPLLDQPTANPAEMALALRTALVRSGLFYESHLANWTVGLDSLEGLMQEPQNRQAADAAHAPASAVTALALTNTSEPAEPKAANPMHTLLTQQLQVLESPHFIWRGELWPGQMLEWQVGQDTDPQADESAATRAQAERSGLGIPSQAEPAATRHPERAHQARCASGIQHQDGAGTSRSGTPAAAKPGTADRATRRGGLHPADAHGATRCRRLTGNAPRPPSPTAMAMRAPRVVAKGRGIVADSIIEKARASGVYVHESRELLALLMQIDLDSHIPPQLYIAVAELLAWLYHLDGAEKHTLPNPHA